MNHKISQEKFEAKVAEKNPTFEVLSQYNGDRGKVQVRCKVCGSIEMVSARTLITTHKCAFCNSCIPRSHEIYERQLKEAKPNIKLLSKFVSSNKKVKCKCMIDGFEWEVRAGNVLRDRGCPECARRKLNRRTDDEFKKEFKEKFKTIEPLTPFKGTGIKMTFKCLDCGYEWTTVPNTLLNGNGKGCPKCNKHGVFTEQDIIKRLKETHPDITYMSGYKRVGLKAKFKCNICNHEWEATVDSVINAGCGCPNCFNSKGEKRVEEYLKENNIKYFKEYKFDDCVYKKKLRFDFYLPDNNTIIETDGEQHTRAVKFFGGEKQYEELKKRDAIKNEYCSSHGIKLLRIPYDDYDNIKEILDKEIA